MLLAPLLVASVLSAEAADLGPRLAVGLDAGTAAVASTAGDLLVPVEFEWAAWPRLSVLGRAGFAMGFGSGRDLYALFARAGLRWYPFSADRFRGFWLELHLGGDAVLATTVPPFGGFRLAASAGAGYAFLLAGRISLTPGVELNPIGLGFPTPGLLILRLGVAFAF